MKVATLTWDVETGAASIALSGPGIAVDVGRLERLLRDRPWRILAPCVADDPATVLGWAEALLARLGYEVRYGDGVVHGPQVGPS